MSRTPMLGTYISYRDVTGKPCTIDSLKEFLSKYKRSEVLHLSSFLNAALESWSGTGREEVHVRLIEFAFPPEHATILKQLISSSSHPRLVFHRAQLLFVAKQALCSCREDEETVLDMFRQPYWGGFGLAFLMANDLLHFEFPNRDGTAEQQALIRMAHSIPLLESGPTNIPNKIGRAWLMLKTFGPPAESKNYFKIEEAFQLTTGLSTDDYLAFCVGMISHYLGITFEQLEKRKESIGLSKDWFKRPHIDFALIDAFLKDVSAPPATLADNFSSRDWGPLDMTWFRDKPVCMLKGSILVAMDARLLSEKFESGVFWRVHSSLDKAKDKERLHIHWGITFENYMNWLLGQACRNSRNIFHASPKYPNGEEVCDAIIVCGDCAVLLEYKGSTFTAESKYRGDLNELAIEINDNLVGSETRRKGIRQLAKSILTVFDKETPAEITGIDLSRITTIFPVIVTRDDIGGCWGISSYLQMQADKFFNRRKLRPRTVTPIFCLSSEGIETLSGELQNKRMTDLLEGWYKNDRRISWSFQTIDNSAIRSGSFEKNTELNTAFLAVFENAAHVLFPGTKSDHHEAEQST
ncbi:MAG: hypothetical protein K2Q17_02365 [Nitrospiraceae bacterium]|nr:hypothetical protein [Nitrospiraceae bacterium]